MEGQRIDLSKIVRDLYFEILRWFKKNLNTCEENFIPEYIEQDINFEDIYDAMYDFSSDIELYYQNVVNKAYPGALKTFKEWSKITNNTSQDDHLYDILKYIKFLDDFRVKYFICVTRTKEQRACLHHFEVLKEQRG